MNPEKNIFKIFLIALWVITFSFSEKGVAQINKDQQVAQQYMMDGEFDKAAEIFEKLYSNDQNPNIYYSYVKCLMNLKSYDQAEKIIKKQVKKFPQQLEYLVDYGFLFQIQNDDGKAKQQYEKAIKLLQPDQNQIVMLANSFLSHMQPDYALQTYEDGKKLLHGQYSFGYETAEVYYQKRDIPRMIDAYMNVLEENPNYLQNIQNTLQARLTSDPDNSKNDILRTAVLKRIQKNPDQPVFSELLIWWFVQQKDFESAFIQAKGLDKRMSEDGGRIMNLAALSSNNLDYDAAIKCYQYLIEKGAASRYYIPSRMELLNTLNKKITENNNYTKEDLLKLEKDYYSTMNEIGRSGNTASLLRGLAHLQAFYLDKSDSAIKMLREVIDYPGIPLQLQALCKLELGDILLFTGDVWESGLLYAQVDLDFKHDELGQEAKFRNAKLDYYRGDFQWAQAQLDVLKSATSQLISNDAMSLSLLISDNIVFDSTAEALHLFSHADLLSYQNKKDEALQIFDSILIKLPGNIITPDVWFKIAGIMDAKKNYQVEDSLLNQIVTKYSDGILADDALFNRAELYERKLNDKKKAMDFYQDLLTKYPGSLYSVEARKRFRALRGDVIN